MSTGFCSHDRISRPLPAITLGLTAAAVAAALGVGPYLADSLWTDAIDVPPRADEVAVQAGPRIETGRKLAGTGVDPDASPDHAVGKSETDTKQAGLFNSTAAQENAAPKNLTGSLIAAAESPDGITAPAANSSYELPATEPPPEWVAEFVEIEQMERLADQGLLQELPFDTFQPLEGDLLVWNNAPGDSEPVVDYEITPPEMLELEQQAGPAEWGEPDPSLLDPEIISPEILKLEEQASQQDPHFEFTGDELVDGIMVPLSDGAIPGDTENGETSPVR